MSNRPHLGSIPGLGSLRSLGQYLGRNALQRRDQLYQRYQNSRRNSLESAGTTQQNDGGSLRQGVKRGQPKEAKERLLPLESASVEQFKHVLEQDVVPIDRLRELARRGVPEEAGLRSTVWKLLLGYLPADRTKWSVELSTKRADYAQFCEELLIKPSKLEQDQKTNSSEVGEEEGEGGYRDGQLTREDVAEHHPLTLDSNNVWHLFHQDNELMEQIDRDVQRTHPDHPFFNGEHEETLKHREELKRALLIFAKLNPGLRYVQGMNELLAPLYYLFRTDPDPLMAAHAEADAFFCFVEIMSDFRDTFCKQLDSTGSGIKAIIDRLDALLKLHSRPLWEHLTLTAKVHPQFYSFRWITLLLTQEYEFEQVPHVWDFIFSAPDNARLDMVLFVCLAMLVQIREDLLAGDFTSNLKMLQRYPATGDLPLILSRALALNVTHIMTGGA